VKVTAAAIVMSVAEAGDDRMKMSEEDFELMIDEATNQALEARIVTDQ
jgi:hypothetical protein